MYKSKIVISLMLLSSLALADNTDNNVSNILTIKLPKVPEVPKVEAKVPIINLIIDGEQVTSSHVELISPKKKVIFSDHVAPDRYSKVEIDEDEKVGVGGVDSGRVSAYLHAPLMEVEDVIKRLTEAGFEVLASQKLDKKGKVVSIVFSDKEMTKGASKTNRGFASTLRVLVDKTSSLTVVANPIYMMKAFMQKEYDDKLAKATLKKLHTAFETLKNSQDVVKFRVLDRFHFMENMPYYEDMKLIKKADNKTLLAMVKKSKNIIYKQDLDNGSTIVGVKLGRRTSKFIKKTGYSNAGLLPYPVLIENGTAKILAPQYYIAVMYPLLKMSQFMKIATIPGAIEKDVDKIFR